MVLTIATGDPSVFNVGLALQVATLIVAAVGPILAYRYARKLSLSANRQAWLDGLRQDIASLIALSDAAAVIGRQREKATDDQSKLELDHLLREKGTELQSARYRIRLRLRAGNPSHSALIEAIDRFGGARKLPPDERHPLRDKVVEQAEEIIQQVWLRIERGG